ncbi:MAG TPA: hypothetical protein VKE51_19060 [Vicinamibacterales bacterium]|nr:hypothetical protein [Vicinamibacterales bacterium]
MRIRVGAASVVAVCLALATSVDGHGGPAQAAPAFSDWVPVPLANGPNQVDIDGDGRQDLVFVAWRDNANAHGYELVTFYRRGPADDPTWELVPFFDTKPAGEDSLHSIHGADCQLRGIAVVRRTTSATEPITVIVGDRDFGRSFADAAGVRFVVYAIARNVENTAGWPPVYFKAERTITSKSSYCDVNDAFAAELGIHTGR